MILQMLAYKYEKTVTLNKKNKKSKFVDLGGRKFKNSSPKVNEVPRSSKRFHDFRSIALFVLLFLLLSLLQNSHELSENRCLFSRKVLGRFRK